MKSGLMKGLMTGALIGCSAATVFGIMNWQTERRWARKAQKTGHWMAHKADELFPSR